MTLKKKLLLHSCCGPCTVYPYDVIKDTDNELTLFYYNPNIHPKEEYLRRKAAIEEFASIYSIPLLIPSPDMSGLTSSEREELWRNTSEEKRCSMCYDTRLKAVAEYAAYNGYDAFSTTLLVSIYQDHDKIIKISKKYAEKYGVEFYYHDFREGFRAGQKKAREMGMYRQKYCGCIVSLDKSPFRDKIIFSLKAGESPDKL